MPAIQLARLKTQVAQLADQYQQPARFIRALHDLLDFYADRTYRPGTVGARVPLLPHYHVAAPVIRQVETELAPKCQSDPDGMLALADALWVDTHLEPRQLAAFILGQAPLDPPEAVTTRLLDWANPTQDHQALEALMARGAARVQRQQTAWWAGVLRGWLAGTPAEQFIGVRGLLALAADPQFANLPIAFDLAGPFIQACPTSLHGALVEILAALARRSPAETAYFLRQALTIATRPEVARLVRRCLPLFDEPTQASLRAALLERRGSSPGSV
jgi:hypothetical protein